MSWTNLYQPPAQPTVLDLHGPEPYDVNFPFPIDLPTLENDLIKLTPFIPRLHMEAFWSKLMPDLDASMRYLPWSVRTKDDLLHALEGFRQNSEWIVFAVIDKTRSSQSNMPGALAGMIGLLNTLPQNRVTEIGAVLTLPAFRRSFVTSNAVGLLLRYCLEPAPHGLGLRRVVWQANPLNLPSFAAAQRMGFRQEGILRWQRVIPVGKEGKMPSKRDPDQRPGRDSVVLSVCWDDWESGVRDTVERAMRPR